jgi:hypothetical protein
MFNFQANYPVLDKYIYLDNSCYTHKKSCENANYRIIFLGNPGGVEKDKFLPFQAAFLHFLVGMSGK